jgi:hypothetical protein
MINSVLTIDCQDCLGHGVIFFGNDNDFDCEPCDCVDDGSLFRNGENN